MVELNRFVYLNELRNGPTLKNLLLPELCLLGRERPISIPFLGYVCDLPCVWAFTNRPELLIQFLLAGRLVVEAFLLFHLFCLFDLYVVIHVNLNLDFLIVLSEGVAHIAFKLGNCEVELEAAVGQEALDYRLSERPNERTLVVRDNFVEVFLDELGLEVGQVEAAVVVRRKLIGDI